jgi:hypothetical protein
MRETGDQGRGQVSDRLASKSLPECLVRLPGSLFPCSNVTWLVTKCSVDGRILMRQASRFEFLLLLALLPLGVLGIGQYAHAGEQERQIIISCFQRGANNFQAMLQCTGAQIPDVVVRSCLSGGPCMDPDPWDQVAGNGAQQLAWQCAQRSGGSVDAFAYCAGQNVILPENEQALLDCAVSSRVTSDFAACAAPLVGIQLNDDQKIVADCAMRSGGDTSDFASCAGSALVGRELTPDQQAILNCAEEANGDSSDFATCSASRIVGPHLSREQEIAIRCAAESQGDSTALATCAGANMFNLNLNPEQQIAVQCVVSTGGQPYAAAGCMATRLTARELTKCLEHGIGGSEGCFGDSNELIGQNGWTARTMRQIAGGPNSVIRNPDQIWGGNNSFVRNPGQIWGGNNSFVRNPSQFWGDNNSIFNNPSQLAPRPLEVGKIGGHRVCVPWC